LRVYVLELIINIYDIPYSRHLKKTNIEQ
jgi:hypothetical protein